MVAFAEGLATGMGCKAIRLEPMRGTPPPGGCMKNWATGWPGSAQFHFEDVIDETLVCFEKALL